MVKALHPSHVRDEGMQRQGAKRSPHEPMGTEAGLLKLSLSYGDDAVSFYITAWGRQ